MKKLTILFMSVLLTLSAFAEPWNFPKQSSKFKRQDKIRSMVKEFSAVNTNLANKKLRSASRLSSYTRRTHDGTVYAISDSTKFTYNGDYGYDYTPQLFEYLGFNTFLYDPFKHRPDMGRTWRDDGTSNLYLSDSLQNTFTTNHKLAKSIFASDNMNYRTSSEIFYDASERKILTVDSTIISLTYVTHMGRVFNASNQVVRINDTTDGVFEEIDSLFYNVEGKLIKVIAYETSTGNPPIYKVDLIYDASGNIVQLDYQDYTGTWVPTGKDIYLYSGTGQMISSTYLEYDGSNFVNSSRDIMVFSNSSALYPNFMESFDWNTTTNMWEPGFKQTFAYNASQQVTFSAAYLWNVSAYEPFDSTAYYYENFNPAQVNNEYVVGAKIYPNPVLNELWMDIQFTESDNVRLQIVSMDGKVVKNQTFENITALHKMIDVSNLNSGLYLLSIKGNKVDFNARFVK